MRCVEALTNGSVPREIITEFVSDKLKDGFVGRSNLFTQIHDFISSPGRIISSAGGSERVLLVTGEPGIGKSTVMCQIIGDRQSRIVVHLIALLQSLPVDVVICIVEYVWLGTLWGYVIRQRMIGSHICMASNALTLSPIRFVRSLALQFCSTVKGFTERLIESPQTVSVLTEDRPQRMERSVDWSVSFGC